MGIISYRNNNRFKIETDEEIAILKKARAKFNGFNTDFCSNILGRSYPTSKSAASFLCSIESGRTYLTLEQWKNLNEYVNNSSK